MYIIRRWSVRHARFMEACYSALEWFLVKLDPALCLIGYDRLEKPVAAVEKVVKSFLFDCQMCGQCILSSTGMSCPMNCPKTLRNGPCGGVREGGYCEVKPAMRCVWVEAWEGAQKMLDKQAICKVQPPVNSQLQGSSSWLRAVRQKVANNES